MSPAHRRYGPWLIALLAALAGVGIWAHLAIRSNAPVIALSLFIPATQPQTAPAPAPAEPPPPGDYVDVIRLHNPDYPATQPWAFPVDLQEAAHIVLHEPVYVCPRGDLWITRPDAAETAQVLRQASDEQTHVIRETVLYVHWTFDQHGRLQPTLICARDGGCDVVTAAGRRRLPYDRPYHWDKAMSWDQRIIVPTDTGVSVLDLDNKLAESYHDLLGTPSTTSQAAAPAPTSQVLFDLHGLLAWIPADGNWHRSTRVARFLDGKWTDLDSQAGWGGSIMHLVPLLDGSVLLIRRGQGDAIQLSLLPLDTPAVDESKITDLVTQLSDDDPEKRAAAFTELTRYGPGVWPVLEKFRNDPSPETEARIEQLLSNKITPKLGGMSLNGERLRVLSRLHDGGVVLFAPDGITTIGQDNQPIVTVPGTLVIRPGLATQELPSVIAKDLNPDAVYVAALRDEWMIENNDQGPQRFMPPGQLIPLLRKNERAYSEWVAIDSRGRWLFREPLAAGSTRSAIVGDTLILDPTLPDPLPRLAVWWIDTGQPVGWDPDNWPVTTRGQDRWALHETDWQLVDKKIASITQAPTPLPPLPSLPPPAPADTQPSTQASTQAATQPMNGPPDGPVLLIDAAGNRYYDGRSTLTLISTKETKTVWPLPPNCVGTGDVWLIACPDGLLFLFNSPGHVIRIRPTPDKPQPFKVEALFTHGIPDAEHPMRIWLDPAGRIDFAYDDNKLAILFPSGQVPPQIAGKILTQDLKLSDEQ